MLSNDDLILAFNDIESDWIERTRSANDTDKLKQFICAQSNDLPGNNRPGVIFIGQEDNLSCSNLNVDDSLLKRLAQLRDDGSIQPIPRIEVRKIEIEGCVLAVVIVAPSQNPPVKFGGRTWIRVGPRKALANGQEERALLEKRQWGNLPFDAQPYAGSKRSDLDVNRFQFEFLPAVVPADVLQQNDRSIDQQLTALRLITPDGVPTNAGLLFLGKSPLDFLPGAYVQFRRVNGTSLTDLTVGSHIVSGTLPDQLRRLDELLSLNIQVQSEIGGELRLESPDYPVEALRQLVRNAVIHRSYDGTNAPVRITWYSNRIEIQNPGGPYGQVTELNFGTGVTDYRNPTIAGLMVQMRFMERFGVGIQIARSSLDKNGNPPLELNANQQHVLVVVRRRP